MNTRQHPSRILPQACALLVAAAAMLSTVAPAHAESTVGTTRARAAIDMRIVIPAFVREKARTDPLQVAIGEADLAQGYVDVDEATSLELTSNGRSGFAISVSYDERLVSRVAMRIDGQHLEAASPGNSLHVQAVMMTAKAVKVGYRLFLKPGAAAGTYRWPVVLLFAPIAV